MPSDLRSPSRERGRTLHSPYQGRRTISPRSRSRESHRPESRHDRPRSASQTSNRTRSASPTQSTKVVVEKLTKNVTEGHLREIFGSFGHIDDLDLPMNRTFNTNRGTAYILYASETDAESAIAHMHDAQIDGMAINVSIVLPRRKFSRSPPPARHMIDVRAPPPPRRQRSPQRFARHDRNADTYRPRSASRSRSRSPRRYRSRSRSRSVSSRSRSPGPRRAAPRRDSFGRSGGRRRRSPSYSSYSSRDRSRSRSRSRDRGGRRR